MPLLLLLLSSPSFSGPYFHPFAFLHLCPFLVIFVHLSIRPSLTHSLLSRPTLLLSLSERQCPGVLGHIYACLIPRPCRMISLWTRSHWPITKCTIINFLPVYTNTITHLRPLQLLARYLMPSGSLLHWNQTTLECSTETKGSP